MRVSTPLVFNFSNKGPIVLQGILDSIIPGMLSLLAIFRIY
ncbi:hypothetical protein ACF3NG_01835 [Aerococcaceae bacterium WGS1372]